MRVVQIAAPGAPLEIVERPIPQPAAGTVRVVDDSGIMRKIVVRTLKQAGFSGHTIEEAENGKDALAKIEADAPDLVLTDWNMPEMNGIDLLRHVRASGNTVRFGFVTSEGTDDMRQLASDEGAEFLITKPFEPDSFTAALTRNLGADSPLRILRPPSLASRGRLVPRT